MMSTGGLAEAPTNTLWPCNSLSLFLFFADLEEEEEEDDDEEEEEEEEDEAALLLL